MNEALAFMTLDANAPFAVSLCVMALIGLVSAVGFDLDGVDGHDGLELPLLNWLNPSGMPMLASLTVLLCTYGLLGLAGQQALLAFTGHLLSAPLAGISAVLPAALVARPINRGLARVMPRDETTAIDVEELIGKRGSIEIGTARRDHPARARFEDHHGQMHLLMVEPSDPDAEIGAGQEILLVAIVDGTGRAITVEPRPSFQL